jgi:hypothetical protein
MVSKLMVNGESTHVNINCRAAMHGPMHGCRRYHSAAAMDAPGACLGMQRSAL